MRWLVLVALATACTPVIDAGGEGGTKPMTPKGSAGNGPMMMGSGGSGAGGSGAVTDPPATLRCESPGTGDLPGPRLLRRLTSPEVDATVRAVFGFDAAAWQGNSLPPDPASLDGFTNNVDRLTVGEDYARGALETAQKVAELVTADAHLTRLLPCAAQGDAACAGTFLDRYATRLYRRPLTAAERARYLALHTAVRAKADFKTWAHWATMTLLQSPNVLYRSELGEPAGGGRWKLTPYEVATALAFTFTGEPPTTELLALAGGNKLETADQLEAAARTLVYQAPGKVRPAFRELMLSFADQWLGLSPLANLKKDEQAFPQFTAAVQESMAEETRRFIANVIFEEQGKPADLLTAPYTFVDATLANFYGLAPPASGFAKVTRRDGWGLGLLAQGSLLAIEAHSLKTSPTKRGYLVRTRLLCGSVPPPPDMVDPLPEPTEAETTRQRYEQLHVKAASCRACHETIDQIGFGLEKLDAVGRHRAKEGAFDIDDSGRIVTTSAGTLDFRGPSELARAVASLPEVADCMASFMAGNAFGLDHRNTACLVRSATAELRAGRMSIAEFYVKLARSEHFRFRVQ
jgi:hypothetical protein